jgi:hypothetical protein
LDRRKGKQMLKTKQVILALALILPILGSCAKEKAKSEITVDQAISVAANEAAKKNFDTNNADIEVLKVKKGLERGPIRMVTLIRLFPREMAAVVINKEYWVIFFYPKGQMEKADTLGGDFTTLVDLHSGEVIASSAGM